jgi:small subunit ribosomal protein S3
MTSERKFIEENVKRVLLKEYLKRKTERSGFGGLDVQRTPMGTRVTLIAERPGMVIGRKGETIKELTDYVQNEFKFDNPQIEVKEESNPNLNPHIMAQKLASALERGWHFRRAGHSTVRRIMSAGAKGCQVIISGKLTGQRHRTEKFREGHIKYCGESKLDWMHEGFAVAKKKLGVIGIKVQIMDPNAKLPDDIELKELSEVATIKTEAGEELSGTELEQPQVEVTEPEIAADAEAPDVPVETELAPEDVSGEAPVEDETKAKTDEKSKTKTKKTTKEPKKEKATEKKKKTGKKGKETAEEPPAEAEVEAEAKAEQEPEPKPEPEKASAAESEPITDESEPAEKETPKDTTTDETPADQTPENIPEEQPETSAEPEQQEEPEQKQEAAPEETSEPEPEKTPKPEEPKEAEEEPAQDDKASKKESENQD